MYNDFVVVGPADDPAGIKGGKDAAAALKRSPRPRRLSPRAATIRARTRRSWRSGKPPASSPPATGTARPARAWAPPSTRPPQMPAYTLTDRGTWITFREQGPARNPRGGRPRPLQPVRRDPGEPGKASAREAGGGPSLHRLASLRRRPARHSRLQDFKISSSSIRTRRRSEAETRSTRPRSLRELDSATVEIVQIPAELLEREGEHEYAACVVPGEPGCQTAGAD